MDLTLIKYAAILIALVSFSLIYLKIALHFNIVDKPNFRSSHSTPVVRGGGILFPFSWILFLIISGGDFWYFTIGLFCISVVSFMDDIRDINPVLRLFTHLLSFTLCFIELNIFSVCSVPAIITLYILCVGTLNAFNFMDGINGITAMYGIVFLTSLLMIPNAIAHEAFPYSYPAALIILLIALFVFGFYNFRKKAKCFAGDIGSVSLAFMLIYFTLHLFIDSKGVSTTSFNSSYKYILLFTVYGVDSVMTILQRIYLRQNIFSAHRLHLYQLLANEMKLGHLLVASAYAIVQFTLNVFVIYADIDLMGTFYILIISGILYTAIKIFVQHKIKHSLPEP